MQGARRCGACRALGYLGEGGAVGEGHAAAVQRARLAADRGTVDSMLCSMCRGDMA
jgi:hypothetical protein